MSNSTPVDGTGRYDSGSGTDSAGRRHRVGADEAAVGRHDRQEVTGLIVDYAPGAASEPHVHPGFGVRLRLGGNGKVSQLGGDEPTTYTKGQSWYESPKKPHVVSKNASKTEPAKLLVFLLSQEGESLKVPIKSPDSGR